MRPPRHAHRGRSPAARDAFTLLEVVLAAAIGLILLSALYFAMNVQLAVAQASREVVAQANLVRGITARITADIAANLGPAPLPPGTGGRGGASGGGSGTQVTIPGSTSLSAGSSTPNGTSTSTSFNLGVQGSDSVLTLYITRVPREVFSQNAAALDPSTPTGYSDLRRVSYWLMDGGLARQEIAQVTSDDTAQLPPSVPNDEASYIIAPEVKSLEFQYFDGTNWQTSWDGTQPGPDGMTPQGPPVAVAFTIGIKPPNAARVKVYRHVVAIQTANGPGQPNTDTNNSTTSSSSSSTTGP